MIPVTLEWVAEKVDGNLMGDNVTIENVSTDTRKIAKGDLFIALCGPNFDGHQFVEQAREKGAIAAIVEKPMSLDIPQVVVENSKMALGKLGAAVKAEVNPLTVGITGSCGKTTVKEMVAAILSARGNVLATEGNFNNDVGVPLTLLRLNHTHDFAVVEMGANHLGEIAYTCSLTKPNVSTIVNAAASHLEGFGSLLGVARAKSEIFKELEVGSTAILNQDSQFYDFWKGKSSHVEQQSFSMDKDADFVAHEITLGMDGCAQFELQTPQGTIWVDLALPGIHNVNNALAAAALSMAVGATLEDIKMGLQNMGQIQGRLNVKQLTDQVRLLDDTYNANVASVNAAIDLLASFSGRRILVLGDMAELGDKGRYYHEQVGEHALESRIDAIYTLGVLSRHSSDVYEKNGKHFNDIDKLVEQLNKDYAHEKCDISILVKGSRSAHMENVVTALEVSPLGKLKRVRESIAC
ncbi:UDP-N-acetylmuramoyl-tripeptide--D-alanyl-D-alanine ligase [Alteromonas sp. a30]|uniref:UDP-N-acetylmuramoyl-tripeptide--D-alanyl-D- alanine ligase n=1 Tax=Alteromonas sp. a30 TaxID=2730917 RepID=UPI00227E83CA|nr:UDP-N-acetylmuramoyl-tripeptide--D-alanyl-D-alanine ligase [Alteromonas sp. a30]MCY7294253.1 UDP-N-acetylmuramoyl-tripeptide--D-alanyl-D-alanine ligase [Alteromonas sp. a30]